MFIFDAVDVFIFIPTSLPPLQIGLGDLDVALPRTMRVDLVSRVEVGPMGHASLNRLGCLVGLPLQRKRLVFSLTESHHEIQDPRGLLPLGDE